MNSNKKPGFIEILSEGLIAGSKRYRALKERFKDVDVITKIFADSIMKLSSGMVHNANEIKKNKEMIRDLTTIVANEIANKRQEKNNDKIDISLPLFGRKQQNDDDEKPN